MFGGRSKEEMKARVQDVLEDAPGLSQSDLVDLAAGLSSRLPNELPFRAAVVAETADDLAAKLRELLSVLSSGDSALGKRWAMPRKGVYVGSGGARAHRISVSGQGSQQLLMARTLIERSIGRGRSRRRRRAR